MYLFVFADIEPQPQHLFAAYHESYITKDAARKLRIRMLMNPHKSDDATSKDYDDLLQEITVPKPKADIYDKKYFDYMPADEKTGSASLMTAGSDQIEPAADIVEFEQLADDDDDDNEKQRTANAHRHEKHKKRFNTKRSKRDITFSDSSDRFIGNERYQSGMCHFFLVCFFYFFVWYASFV